MHIRFSLREQAWWVALPALLACATPAHALNVFACEPEWAALTRELAGDQATIYTATHALQDPHLVQAKPSLIAAVRNADLVVCTGAELEVAWLPVLLLMKKIQSRHYLTTVGVEPTPWLPVGRSASLQSGF